MTTTIITDRTILMTIVRHRFLIHTFFLSSLILLSTQSAWATGEIAYSEGNMEAIYEESTDSQSTRLGGSNRVVSYRSLEALSILDLGIQWGTYSLSGESALHDVQLSSDYVNLIAGVNFRLSPNWLEYRLDLGYRLSVDRIDLDQSDSGKTTKHKIGSLRQQPFSEISILAFTSRSFFIGLNYEQQDQVFNKGAAGLNPQVTSAETIYLTLGYRFGPQGKVINPNLVPSGPSNYNDPCQLFKSCD